MSSPDKVQKGFLLGVIVLGTLIIGGIVWAIAAGPGPVVPVSFNDENDPVTGSGQAQKVFRIFGDFQCPACRSAEAGVRHVREKFGSEIKIVWNDYPLAALHPNAIEAANAARCAQDQGKFWEYHDKLYDDQPSWESLPRPTQKFVDYATALDLESVSFKTCLESRKNKSKIDDDISEGNRIGVNATPTFYVGSKQIVGGLSNAQWDAEIDELITEGQTIP